MLKINLICLFDPLMRYFVSSGLSPNPSPEVGGALIQDKCVYFGWKYGNNKGGIGITVYRFTSSQILHGSDLVVEKINATIKELTTTSSMIFPRSHRERGSR